MSDAEIKPTSGSPPGVSAEKSSPAFALATQPSYAKMLLFGLDGLRPGWGFAFYAVVFYVGQQVAVQLASSPNLGANGLWAQLLEEFASLLAAAIPAVILAKVEGRRWGAYGLPGLQLFGRRFWIGAVWGLAAISLLVFALYGLHSFDFGHIVLHGKRVFRFASYWALMFVVVGLFEEFLFRGYSQFTLTRGIGFWPSAIALSCLFGLIHRRNGGEQWAGLLAAAFIGLFFCLTLRRTGTLWFAVGFHAAWDWGETFLYSVPDSGMVAPGHLLSSSLRGPDWLSGGSVGPEGSVVCFLVIALVWIVFERTHPAVALSQARN